MTDGPALLIVDDEPDIRDALTEYFSMNGFAVHEAENGAAMRRVMAAERVDVVILDVRMPGEDGLVLCRELRSGHDVGIIMLTGSAETVDRVVGLELGADDYVAKPYDLRELLARVKSVHRRVRGGAPDDVPSKTTRDSSEEVSIGDFTLNLATRSLLAANGEPVPLTSMEFDLLKALSDRPNRVFSRDQLLELAHNRDWEPFDRSIDVRITRLRKKIERDPAKPRLIRTVRGAGYLFSPDGS